MAILLVVLLLLCAPFYPASVSAQTNEGIILLGKDVDEKIALLEGALNDGSSASVEFIATMLLWLADLYEGKGDYDNAEWSYQRILAYIPHEVGVMNSYALFLLEKRQQIERAESVLVAASRWGRMIDARSLNRARTFELLARVELVDGDYESAIHHAGLAIELVDEESSVGARRTLAEAYRRSGALDKAARTYIDVIALERGSDREDINALKLFVDQTENYKAEDVNGLIDDAVQARQAHRRELLEAEGAKLVSLVSADGVTLEATLRRRDGTGAVLFIPDLQGTRSIYTPYAQLLGIDGVSSLSLDLRGQGGSRSDTLLSQRDLPLEHALRLPDDVVAGFRFLQTKLGLAEGQIIIVSEGLACGIVEKALRRGHLSAPVVHLSPSFDFEDRNLKTVVTFHPDAPVLYFYNDEDLYSIKSYAYYQAIKELPKLKVYTFGGAGHGVDILRRNPQALETFQAWVRQTAGSR